MASGNVIDSFFIALGFEVEEGGIEKYEQLASNLSGTVLGLTAAFVGLSAGLGVLIENTTKSLGALSDFAELNNVSAREVQALELASIDFDVSQQGVRDTLQSLNKELGQAALNTGRARKIFAQLGLSAKDAAGEVKSAIPFLGEILNKIQGLSNAEQIGFLSKLQIDPNYLKAIKEGNVDLAALIAENAKFVPFTDIDYERADKIEKQFEKIRYSLGLYAQQLAVKLFPIVQKLAGTFLAFLRTQQQTFGPTFLTGVKIFVAVVQGGVDWMTRLFNVFKAIYDPINKLVPVIAILATTFGLMVALKLATWFAELVPTIGKVATALFKLDAAAIPAVALALLAAAIFLLGDDLINFHEGNKSIIGQLSKDFPKAADLAHYAFDALLALFIFATPILNFLLVAFLKVSFITLKYLVPSFNFLLYWLGRLVGFIVGPVLTAIQAMILALTGIELPIIAVAALVVGLIVGIYELWKHWSTVTKWLGDAWDYVVDKVDVARDKILAAWDSVKKFFTTLSDNPFFRIALAATTFGGSEVAYAGAAAATGQQIDPYGFRGSGILGNTNNSQAVSNTTQISAPITIVTPDPARAGQNVQDHFDNATAAATRNGQSAWVR